MNKILKVFLGLLVSAICLWFSFKNFDLESLKQSFAQASWFWVLPSMAIYMTGHMIRSFRWAIILSPFKMIKPIKIFPILFFGFFINNILPLRAGELARSYALSRAENIKLGTIIGSIAVERLSDMFGLIFMAGLALLFYEAVLFDTSNILLSFFIGVTVLTLGILVGKKWLPQLQKSPHKLVSKVMGFLDQVIIGFASLKSPLKIAKVLWCSMIIWLIEPSTLFIMGSKVFHLDLSFVQAIIIDLGLCLGVMIPSSPGYVGTFEFFGKETMKKLGFALNPSLSFLLALHFFYAFASCLIGFPYLLKFGLGGSTTNQNKQHALPLHI